MGCDFFYSGTLADTALQQKVINLAASYFSEIALYIHPKPESEYLTKYYTRSDYITSPKLYPFNYYGIIPYFEDKLCDYGQFVFDRTDGGKLIRFEKLPNCFDKPPWDDLYINEEAEVVLTEGGHTRMDASYAFALLLNLMKIRWWPELWLGDDYDVCSDVGGFLKDTGLDITFNNEGLGFKPCYDLFIQEKDRLYPPRQKPEYKPSPDAPKPTLRIVHPNPEQIVFDSLDLSARASSCLKKAGIKTAGELLQYSETELLNQKVRNIKIFGHKSLREIKEILESYGLSLRPE